MLKWFWGPPWTGLLGVNTFPFTSISPALVLYSEDIALEPLSAAVKGEAKQRKYKDVVGSCLFPNQCCRYGKKKETKKKNQKNHHHRCVLYVRRKWILWTCFSRGVALLRLIWKSSVGLWEFCTTNEGNRKKKRASEDVRRKKCSWNINRKGLSSASCYIWRWLRVLWLRRRRSIDLCSYCHWRCSRWRSQRALCEIGLCRKWEE